MQKKRVHNVAIEQVKEVLIQVFRRWGKPQCIKVDNGLPFVNPPTDVPTPLALYLIGLGIKVIRIRPYQPQDNAKVERVQDTTYRWAEPERQNNVQQLNEILEQTATIQREEYRCKSLNYQTRMEAFPQLAKAGKPFNEKDFDLVRVLAFLAKGMWVRKTNYKGLFSFFSQRWYVGPQYRNCHLVIHLDLQANQWVIEDDQGNEIKRFPNDIITNDRILNLAIA